MTIKSIIRTKWEHNDSKWWQLEGESEHNDNITIVNGDN
jgi:hypothetical protein